MKSTPIQSVQSHVFLSIGKAAQLAGLTAKRIRHYESLGLLGDVTRSENGYRLYNDADIHRLRFVHRARELGFSMLKIADLMSLWSNPKRTSAQVKKIAQHHVDDLQNRIVAMQSMQKTLKHLLHHCSGDDRPECPILADLAGQTE